MKLASSFVAAVALFSTTTMGQPAGGGSFYLTQCTQGCSSGAGGAQVSCSILQGPPNVTLTFAWSDDVDLASVTFATLRIIDVNNGTVPVGTFVLKDPRTVAFTPTFGFSLGATYQVFIPGTGQGDKGPFVQSTSGVSNESRLVCSFTTNGPPSSVVSECVTTPNSVGPGAVSAWCGSSSLGLNDLAITVGGLPPGALAMPIAANTSNALPFGDGVLCVGLPFVRSTPASAPAGTFDFDVDWPTLAAKLDTSAGATVRFQLVYRDAAGGPAGFNLSDAVAADLVP